MPRFQSATVPSDSDSGRDMALLLTMLRDTGGGDRKREGPDHPVQLSVTAELVGRPNWSCRRPGDGRSESVRSARRGGSTGLPDDQSARERHHESATSADSIAWANDRTWLTKRSGGRTWCTIR